MRVSGIHVYHAPWEAVRDALAARDPTRRAVHASTPADIVDAEVVITSVPPRGAFAGARRLRLVQGMGVGLDHFYPIGGDVPAGVPVACGRGVFREEVAEHAIALLLAMVIGLPTHLARQATRTWKPFAHGKVAGSRLAVLGAGAVGMRIAAIGRALRAEVTLVGRTTREGVTADLVAAARDAEVLLVACARTPETLRRVNASVIGALRPGARIVAVARGGIVDEAALLDALTSGHLGGAALDVFAEEPLAPDHPLWDAPNVVITPHVAGHGLDYVGHMVDRLLENVRRLEAGEPLLDVVDPTRGY